jgi:carboxypeptidase C (cathepsin A)
MQRRRFEQGTRTAIVLLAAMAAIPAAWPQGGRGRSNVAQQTPAQPAATPATTPGRGGRGAAPAPTTSEFYNYDASAASAQAIPDSTPAETHQKITVNGQALAYTARVGYLPLRNATTGQSEAHLFYTSYSKDGDAVRPLVFFLGGAPGVAASWQEFGGLGPKRMKPMSEGAQAGSMDNPSTLLGQADLVFVNPVGTALSRPDQPVLGANFWNTPADIASLSEFVRSYLTHFNRSGSPLFLAGEDLGTGRVAGVAGYLIEHQVPVHGVVLLSMAMSADSQAGDTKYLTLLPSLIMTAWHHKKLSADLNAMSAEQIAGQARQLASREYLHALYKGDRMSADERAKALADLSRFTGLSKAFLLSNDLRITLDRFNGELFHEQHRGLAFSDSRVTGFVPTPTPAGRGGGGGFGFAPPTPIDFNLSALAGPFLTAYQDYLHRELTFNGAAGGIYYLLSGGIGTFTATGNDDAALSGAFARNPNLRLFVGIDYYDLNAPFYAAEYTLAHLNVSPEVRAHNITVSHLEAGQMAYADSKALVKLGHDLGSFVEASTPK